MIEIGKIIEKILREQNFPVARFAKNMNTNRTNVYNIFGRNSIDSVLLQKIGEVLKHDFFKYYITDGTKSEILKDPENLVLVDKEIISLKKKIEFLIKENDELRSRIKDKELIIELMKK